MNIDIDLDLDFQNALKEYKEGLKEDDFLLCLSIRDASEGEAFHLSNHGEPLDIATILSVQYINHMKEQNEDSGEHLADVANDLLGAVAIMLASNSELEDAFLKDLELYKQNRDN